MQSQVQSIYNNTHFSRYNLKIFKNTNGTKSYFDLKLKTDPSSLLNQLSDYGLNPQDWKMKSFFNKHVIIVHKEDADYQFKIEFCNLKIKKISLYAI